MSMNPPSEALSTVPKVLRIGREPDNDLVVNLPTVSGYHARAIWEGRPGEATIEDLGSANGTAIGTPGRASGRLPVTPTDAIYLGNYLLPAARVFEALGLSQDEVKVGPSPVVIGRDESCDKVVNLPVVSGRHARLIRRNDGSVVVEDLGSANGTFINGVRVDRVATARAGDLLGLGSVSMVLAVEPLPAAQTQVLAPPASRPVTLIRVSDASALDAPTAETLGTVLSEELQAEGRRAWIWGLILILGSLAALLAIGQAGIPARVLGPAQVSAAKLQAIAVRLSRISVMAVGLGLLCGLAAGRPLSAGLQRWAVRAGVAALVCLVECLIVWALSLTFNGNLGHAMAILGLLGLGSAAALAMGLTLSPIIPRTPLTWVAATVLFVPLLGLGGEAKVWKALPGWAKTLGELNPSRWTFEGLLLIDSDRRSTASDAEDDLIEPYFPAKTDRTGPRTVTHALLAMILGWGTAAVFNAAAASTPRPRSRAL